MSNPPTLSNMPAPVLDVVMKEVDLKTIQSVRKVCYNLRAHIDSIQMDAKLLKAFVYASSSEKIAIQLNTVDDIFDVTYKQDGNNCVIDHGGSRVVENEDVGSCVGNDLGLILINQKSLIKEITLLISQHIDETIYENFLRNLTDHLATRKNKLQVTYFSWSAVINQNRIMRVLEHFDPSAIQKISLLNGAMKKGDELLMFDLGRIANSDQWKQAKKLETLGLIAQIPFNDFFHFWRAHFMCETINVEGLIAMRQLALGNPKFDEFCCVYSAFPDEAEFLNRFGKEHLFRRKIRTWHYKFPRSKNALIVEWKPNSKEKSIRFLKIRPKVFVHWGISSDKLVDF